MSNPDDVLEDPFSFIEDLPDKPISSRPTEEYAKENKQNQQPDLSSTAQTPDKQELVIPPIETDPEEESQDTRSLSIGKVGHFVRRFSPVLVPLPFAVLIFLFTLPFALKGLAVLPLLPLGVLLTVLALIQGAMLYYAGSNGTYWTLFVIIGYALFLAVGTLAIFGFGPSLILLFLLLMVGTFLARRSIRQVPEGYVDIVLMYGKYARTLYPGLNLKMPWEKVSSRLNTKAINWTCPEQVGRISRDQDVKLVATISYQLVPEDAHIAAQNVKDWEEALQKLFVGTIRSVINELTPADFLNWQQGTHVRSSFDISSVDDTTVTRWDRINETLERRVQDQVASWGVQINFVRIREMTLIPHLVPGVNPGAGMAQRQPSNMGMTRSGYPQAPPVAASVPIASIDTLKDLYEAVRVGRVKDPETIRDIAMQFAELAKDPNVSFDAALAAQNLYQRAWLYEQENKQKARVPDAVPDEPISSQPTEEYPLEETGSGAYPSMEELQPRMPPMETLIPKTPPQQRPSEYTDILLDESARTREEEALTIKFVIGKLIDYTLLLLLVLELIFLTRLLLKLIGANPNNFFAGFLYGLSNLFLFPFSGIAPSLMIHPLNQPLEVSTLVGMFVYFLIFFVLVRFLIILISVPKFPKDEDLDLKPLKATKERAFASKFAITQVRSFYENTRRRFKPWLFFSVIAITLGTLCIASIYIIPYLGKFSPISENTTTIITTIIAGGSLYIIALLSFFQNREAYKQVNSYYTAKLIEAEKISQLTKLASRTPVSEAQEHINEKIISQILLPLDTVLDTTEKTVLGRGVPNLQKLDLFAAAERASAFGMKVVPVGEDASYPNIESGLIVAQNPLPGTLMHIESDNPEERPQIQVILSKRP